MRCGRRASAGHIVGHLVCVGVLGIHELGHAPARLLQHCTMPRRAATPVTTALQQHTRVAAAAAFARCRRVWACMGWRRDGCGRKMQRESRHNRVHAAGQATSTRAKGLVAGNARSSVEGAGARWRV